MGDVTYTAQTNFSSNMRLELQQNKPLLAPTAKQRNVAGAEKTKVDNLIANGKTRKKTERNGQVIHDSTGWDGVWVAKPDPDYLATLVDAEDKLLTEVDLEGGELMNHSGAIVRAKDSGFIEGIFGDMITGKTGTTLNAFPAANIVQVGYKGPGVAEVDCGLNIAKIRRARRILARNFVDLRQNLYLALSSLQVEQLTSEAQAIDADYLNSAKPRWSEDGKFLMGLAGFDFIEFEFDNTLLSAEAIAASLSGANRKVPFWSADGMLQANWEELFTDVVKLPTQHYSTQVYSRCQQVFSRTDQNRCGYILCTET